MVGDESGPTSEISNQAVANGSLFGKFCGPLTAESVVIETTTIDTVYRSTEASYESRTSSITRGPRPCLVR